VKGESKKQLTVGCPETRVVSKRRELKGRRSLGHEKTPEERGGVTSKTPGLAEKIENGKDRLDRPSAKMITGSRKGGAKTERGGTEGRNRLSLTV